MFCGRCENGGLKGRLCAASVIAVILKTRQRKNKNALFRLYSFQVISNLIVTLLHSSSPLSKQFPYLFFAYFCTPSIWCSRDRETSHDTQSTNGNICSRNCSWTVFHSPKFVGPFLLKWTQSCLSTILKLQELFLPGQKT